MVLCERSDALHSVYLQTSAEAVCEVFSDTDEGLQGDLEELSFSIEQSKIIQL